MKPPKVVLIKKILVELKFSLLTTPQLKANAFYILSLWNASVFL
jgi:hypothetical protein